MRRRLVTRARRRLVARARLLLRLTRVLGSSDAPNVRRRLVVLATPAAVLDASAGV